MSYSWGFGWCQDTYRVNLSLFTVLILRVVRVWGEGYSELYCRWWGGHWGAGGVEFQLSLWTSSSHILLTQGNGMLVFAVLLATGKQLTISPCLFRQVTRHSYLLDRRIDLLFSFFKQSNIISAWTFYKIIYFYIALHWLMWNGSRLFELHTKITRSMEWSWDITNTFLYLLPWPNC